MIEMMIGLIIFGLGILIGCGIAAYLEVCSMEKQIEDDEDRRWKALKEQNKELLERSLRS